MPSDQEEAELPRFVREIRSVSRRRQDEPGTYEKSTSLLAPFAGVLRPGVAIEHRWVPELSYLVLWPLRLTERVETVRETHSSTESNPGASSFGEPASTETFGSANASRRASARTAGRSIGRERPPTSEHSNYSTGRLARSIQPQRIPLSPHGPATVPWSTSRAGQPRSLVRLGAQATEGPLPPGDVGHSELGRNTIFPREVSPRSPAGDAFLTAVASTLHAAGSLPSPPSTICESYLDTPMLRNLYIDRRRFITLCR